MYFLLLHACELAIKSIAISRTREPTNSHDIVKLLRCLAIIADRAQFRKFYFELRKQKERGVREKWSGQSNSMAEAAMEIELETMRQKPLTPVNEFKVLGSLGQSDLLKLEFGEKVDRWWHSARYPRHGITSYPEFETCKLICENLIEVAEEELGSSHNNDPR